MRYFTIATAGHVDHGKTSLLRALTGIDPDRLKEEKERQMTTDLGFAHLSSDDMVVGFVDVPGHGKFLKNMLAGVGGIDMAMLVVASDEGPMPQTIQHVRILSFLGVPNILVALNKIDTCDAERANASRQKVEDLLQEYSLNVVGIVPVSATKEDGIAELKKCIFQLCGQMNEVSSVGALFFPIDRAFIKPGFGTVVTGTLVNGQLRVGDQVFVGSKNVKAKVRRLESFGKTIDAAQTGQRVAVNLSSKENLVRGDVLLGEQIEPANVLITSLFTCPPINADNLESCDGQDVRIYHGTSETIGKIRLSAPANSVGGSVLKIALNSPLFARPGDRLVVRLGDDTICGGSVLLLDPPRWLTKTKLSRLAEPLIRADYVKALQEYLFQCPQGLARAAEIEKLLPTDSPVINELLQIGLLAKAHDCLMTKDKYVDVLKKIVDCAPNSLEAIRHKVLPAISREVFQDLVQQLVSLKQIVIKGDKLMRPEDLNKQSLASNEKECSQIKTILLDNLCLEIDEIARRINADPKLIRACLMDLSKEKQAAIVSYEFAALQENIERCHRAIADIWHRKRDIAPGEFRETLGISRKYAMALLSYFDDQQITRRLPSGRVLLKAPSN